MSSVTVTKASVILAFKFVISGTGVENTVSLTYPHKNKLRGVIPDNRGGQDVGPSLPTHLFGNVASKNRRTCEAQCGGAPSCWKIIHVMVKKVCIPRSFLVINVCNQGKTLCSPCISNKMKRYTVLLYPEIALHISGGTSTHHQERKQLYLQSFSLLMMGGGTT